MSPSGSMVSDWGSSGGIPQSWSSKPYGANPSYGTTSMMWTTSSGWTAPQASCPPNATPCPGECFLPDSCGGEYVWTPASDLPPIATNILTVDASGNVIASTIECNSDAFSASYPTGIAAYVTQQLGPSCDLELVADGSTITQTVESGSILYLGACGVAAENVPVTEGASCCSAAPTLSWDSPIWYTGSFYPTTVSGYTYSAYAAPSIWDLVPPLSTVPGCSILLPSETGITFPGPLTYTSTVTTGPPPTNSPPPYSPPPYSENETTTTTTTTELVPSIETTTIPLISVETSVTTDYITSTTTIPPIVQTTTLTRTLSGSTTTFVSTLTQSGTTSVVTQQVTRTLPPIIETKTLTTSLGGSTTTLLSTITKSGTTSIEIEQTTVVETKETTITASNPVTVTKSLIPITSGEIISVVGPSYTIPNVATAPPCAGPGIENFFDVQWLYWAPPSSNIPPMATHQPIVYPNNQTSTSIYCNTTVFEKYLRTQLFDCRLGRGPYQTLDCDCNIIVGPVFTGDGPTPTGPGITVTQRGPSGAIVDLGTSISANNIPVTGAGGQVICASTTTSILATPFIYQGPITIVPSFYRTVQLGKRSAASGGTTHAILPNLSKSSDIAPLTQPLANIGPAPPRSTTTLPGASTTTLSSKPWNSPATELPLSSGLTSAPVQTSSTSSTSTTTPPTPSTPPTTKSSTPQQTPAPPSSSTVTSPSIPASSSPALTPTNGVHTTNICQVVTYTGHTGFVVPELVVGADNSTMTETALASELTAGIDSYICSVVGGCEHAGPTASSTTGSAIAATSSGTSPSTSVAPATGLSSHITPAWWLYAVMGFAWLMYELHMPW